MRVLLTADEVSTWTGGELYVFELAHGLRRRGHEVAVHVLHTGPLADELVRDGIPVLRRPSQTRWRPDVIHAQGSIGTRAALATHRGVPVLFVCHSHDRWTQFVPLHPSVRRYAGVSRVCTDALLRNGTPPDRTILLPNFVDTTTFTRRPPLPAQPRRALMFSNYAKPGGFLDAVEAACKRMDLQLDHLGTGTGTAKRRPADVLPHYDIVFAKGRAAIEALAVGCAVILCDFAGVGPMVALADYDRLREANFGFGALTRPHGPDVLCSEIQRYDPDDAAAVCDRIRDEGSLERYVERLEETYRVLIDEAAQLPQARRADLLERGRVQALTFAVRTYRRIPIDVRWQLRPLVGKVLRAP